MPDLPDTPLENSDAAQDAEQLPPVQPPSAGFIMQLFLVPGLIVVAVIGVWVLFGKMASSEQDWQKLVTELGSPNEHRRWRAALGLAQLLKAGEQQDTAAGGLSQNPRVATALAGLFQQQLQSRTQKSDDLKQQAFLARTLGSLDAPDQVLPVLQQAMHRPHDREVRKNAMASVAVIAGRTANRSARRMEPKLIEDFLETPSLVDDVIDVSYDPDPLMRQLAAYTLGLLPVEQANERLLVLLDDSDVGTSINAAVGLARQSSSAGLPVFKQVLRQSTQPIGGDAPGDPTDPNNRDDSQTGVTDQNAVQSERFQRQVALRNTLKALDDLSDELSDDEQQEVIGLLETVAEQHDESMFRLQARRILNKLK